MEHIKCDKNHFQASRYSSYFQYWNPYKVFRMLIFNMSPVLKKISLEKLSLKLDIHVPFATLDNVQPHTLEDHGYFSRSIITHCYCINAHQYKCWFLLSRLL